MGDRLGIPGAVGFSFSTLFLEVQSRPAARPPRRSGHAAPAPRALSAALAPVGPRPPCPHLPPRRARGAPPRCPPFLDALLHSLATSLSQPQIILHSLPPSRSPSFIPLHSFPGLRPSLGVHPFTHSLTHSLTHSFIHSFTHSFTHSLTHSCIHSFIHSFIHSPFRSFTAGFLGFSLGTRVFPPVGRAG